MTAPASTAATDEPTMVEVHRRARRLRPRGALPELRAATNSRASSTATREQSGKERQATGSIDLGDAGSRRVRLSPAGHDQLDPITRITDAPRRRRTAPGLRPGAVSCPACLRVTVRTTPDISLVARRAVTARAGRAPRPAPARRRRGPPRNRTRRRTVSSVYLAEQPHAPLQLARLQPRHQPDRPVEQPDEPCERRQPVPEPQQLEILRVVLPPPGPPIPSSARSPDDRVALADLPLGDALLNHCQ